MTTATEETYEQSQARRNKEEQAQVLGFVQKLHEVELEGWAAETDHHKDHSLPHSVTFTHAETGAAFWVGMPNRSSARHGKIEAHGAWPKDADGKRKSASDWGLCGYSEDPYRIGFGFKKTAKAITSDLKRRLVPGLLEGMAVINKRLAKQQAEKSSIARDVARLQDAFETHDVREQSYCSAELRFHEYTTRTGRDSSGGSANGLDGSVKLRNYRSSDTGGNSVDLKLSDLTVDQAIAIAELIKKAGA